MIPSEQFIGATVTAVYQRGLVIDSQRVDVVRLIGTSISKGIGD